MGKIVWVTWLMEEGNSTPFDKCVVYMDRAEECLLDATADTAEGMTELYYRHLEGDEENGYQDDSEQENT